MYMYNHSYIRLQLPNGHCALIF